MNKEECIKKLLVQSTFEENKKIMDVQDEFEKKIKSRCNYKYLYTIYSILYPIYYI